MSEPMSAERLEEIRASVSMACMEAAAPAEGMVNYHWQRYMDDGGALLAEVDRLRAENLKRFYRIGELAACLDAVEQERDALLAEVHRLRAENVQMRERLEFWVAEAEAAGGDAIPRKFNWIKNVLSRGNA
jgi:hypothetical protein